MMKEGITGKNSILKHYVDICNIVEGDVSAEVNAVDYDGMIREGEELADLHDQIVVKLPMTKDGIKACKYFSEKGIKTNVTLVVTPSKTPSAWASRMSARFAVSIKNLMRSD